MVSVLWIAGFRNEPIGVCDFAGVFVDLEEGCVCTAQGIRHHTGGFHVDFGFRPDQCFTIHNRLNADRGQFGDALAGQRHSFPCLQIAVAIIDPDCQIIQFAAVQNIVTAAGVAQCQLFVTVGVCATLVTEQCPTCCQAAVQGHLGHVDQQAICVGHHPFDALFRVIRAAVDVEINGRRVGVKCVAICRALTRDINRAVPVQIERNGRVNVEVLVFDHHLFAGAINGLTTDGNDLHVKGFVTFFIRVIFTVGIPADHRLHVGFNSERFGHRRPSRHGNSYNVAGDQITIAVQNLEVVGQLVGADIGIVPCLTCARPRWVGENRCLPTRRIGGVCRRKMRSIAEPELHFIGGTLTKARVRLQIASIVVFVERSCGLISCTTGDLDLNFGVLRHRRIQFDGKGAVFPFFQITGPNECTVGVRDDDFACEPNVFSHHGFGGADVQAEAGQIIGHFNASVGRIHVHSTIAVVADQRIVTASTRSRVISTFAHDEVVPTLAKDHVIICTTIDGVIPADAGIFDFQRNRFNALR